MYLLTSAPLELLKLIILWWWALGQVISTRLAGASPLLTGVHHHPQLLPDPCWQAFARVLAEGQGSWGGTLAGTLGNRDGGNAAPGVQQGTDFGVWRGLCG